MALTNGEGSGHSESTASVKATRFGTRRAMLAGGAVVAFVVIFASVSTGAISPGAADRLEPSRDHVYQRQVLSNPGLAKTETFAALGCYPGDVLLSGGYSGVDEGTLITANGPDPASSEETWLVGWKNDDSSDAVDVRVLCLDQSVLSARQDVPHPN